jgi:hypothetical protein
MITSTFKNIEPLVPQIRKRADQNFGILLTVYNDVYVT